MTTETPTLPASSSAKPVLSKADFVRRYYAGEFGNHSPTWDNLEQAMADPSFGLGKLYHVRNRVANALTWYNVTGHSLPYYWHQRAINEHGYRPSQLYISEMVPRHVERSLLIQGEVMRAPWGLSLYYSTALGPMRTSLRAGGTQVQGIIAVYLLRSRLCPNSYAWLQHLLDAYEDHVVEFSCFKRCWGTVPGMNTVFWEVRKY